MTTRRRNSNFPRRLVFLAPGDVGKGRVEPISWMQTCAAYAEKGLDVTLVTLKVRRPEAVPRREVWRHYGLEPTFRLVVVPTALGRNAGVAASRVWAGAAALAVTIAVLSRQLSRRDRVIVHTRLPILAAPFLLAGRLLPKSRRPQVVFETHVLPRSSHGWVLRNVDLVVTNSQRLADEIVARWQLPARNVLHAPLPPFNRITPQDKAEARARLGLASDFALACYTGKLTEEHGDFLLRVARNLATHHPQTRLVVVGGNPEILEWMRARASALGADDALELTGFVEPHLVSDYQAAADVLVHYMPETMTIFPYCTPAKAYEYQAAERPIVATDLPLFEEVFGSDGERAIRVPERTPEALAAGVRRALLLEDGGRAMSTRAASWVRERTWPRRVALILEALERR